jgi:signal transduction histidine kinase
VLALGAPTLAALIGLVVALRADEPGASSIVAVHTAAVALTLTAGLVALVRGLWTGNAPPALRGVALVVTVVAVLGPEALRDATQPEVSGAWLFSSTAASLACGALLVASSRWPQVDTRVRPLPLVGAVAGGAVLAMAIDAGLIGAVEVRTQSAVAACAWLVAGVVYLLARRPGPHGAALWPAPAMLALAAGFAATASAELTGTTAALHLVAGATAAAGAAAGMLRDAMQDRWRVHRLRVELADASARADDSRLLLASASHDLGNAVTAIVGASETIARHIDRLDPETRHRLLEALADQAARVHEVVAAVLDRPEPGDRPQHASHRREIGSVAAGAQPDDD